MFQDYVEFPICVRFYRKGIETFSVCYSLDGPSSSDLEIMPKFAEGNSSGRAICNIQPFRLKWHQPKEESYDIEFFAKSSIDEANGWLTVLISRPGMFRA